MSDTLAHRVEIAPRYRAWPNQPGLKRYLHLFRIAGSLNLTFRRRTFRFWTVGVSCYAVNPVRDIALHLGVISIGLKWHQRRAEVQS